MSTLGALNAAGSTRSAGSVLLFEIGVELLVERVQVAERLDRGVHARLTGVEQVEIADQLLAAPRVEHRVMREQPAARVKRFGLPRIHPFGRHEQLPDRQRLVE